MGAPDHGLRWFGASVAGPRHCREGQPNEDAWLGRGRGGRAAVAVADGLGSAENARAGARAACRAVWEALGSCRGRAAESPELLLRLVHLLWAVWVQPVGTQASATTCLFAVATPGDVLLAQLGDGLAALRLPDGTVECARPERTGFGNLTTGLGIARQLSDWGWLRRPAFAPGAIILLASDGVADDLKVDRLGDFMVHLVKEYGPLPASRRRRALAAALRAWPTPKHLDDKTVAVLWRGAGEGDA